MAKVWLCRSGVVGQSCGEQPFAELSVSECRRVLELRRSDYLCPISEIGQHRLTSSPQTCDGRVRVEMGRDTSYADPEHVVVVVEVAEGSDEWQSGVYCPMISCSEAQERLTDLPD